MEYVVKGTVTDGDGLTIANATVTVFLVNMRSATMLVSDETTGTGEYSISFDVPDQAANIRLEVSLDTVLQFTSEIYFNVPNCIVIPLSLGGQAKTASEVSELTAAFTPWLSMAEIGAAALTEDATNKDITFLSGDTEYDKAWVAMYAIAARLAQVHDVDIATFYAAFRMGVPIDASELAIAPSEDGIDLDVNAETLLAGLLAATSATRTRALETALAQNIVPPSYAAVMASELAELDTMAVTAGLGSTGGTGNASVGDVLQSASIPQNKQEAFIALYAAWAGDDPGFWDTLIGNPTFTSNDVATIRFTITVSRHSLFHRNMVNRLLAMRVATTISHERDLAERTAAQWLDTIRGLDGGLATGVPPNIPGATTAEKEEAYAAFLEQTFERGFPTTAFKARLEADGSSPVTPKQDIVDYIDGHDTFDLLTSNIDPYITGNPPGVGVSVGPLREGLLICQRVARLVPRYAAMKPLIADGIQSAQQIYVQGKDRFIAKYAGNPAIGADIAARTYDRASQTYAMALNLMMQLHAPAIGPQPLAIGPQNPMLGPGPNPEITDFPNLQTLFGSLDMCACKHCRSVLSPAAYLVDALHFLSHRITGTDSAKDVLLERRPDLVNLELSCTNTNTVLPYLDLVNEILEDAIAPPPTPGHQTTLTTPELNANPEHVNAAAYTTLAGAVYPWGLPFDLPLAEARTYLGHLGADRVALMAAFQPLPVDPWPNAVAVAIEGLGLLAVEADIIIGGPLAVSDSWEYWGLAESGNTVSDPVDPAITYTGDWTEVLAHARVMLHRSGLTLQTLREVLNTRFVNPSGNLELVFDPEGSCQIRDAVIQNLSAEHPDLIHRFVRLMRRMDWTAYELDAAIALLQSGTTAGLPRLNSTLLRQLHAVKLAKARFRIPVTTAVAVLGNIDTRSIPRLPGEESDRPSLYRDLFLNRMVLNPVDAAYLLNSEESEIVPGSTIAAHRPTLLGALEISDADLSLAVATLSSGSLTLANVSQLHRYVVLARGLRLSIPELLSALELVEMEWPTDPPHEPFEPVDPFDSSRPEMLAIFCDAIDRMRRAGFTVAELDYLLRHVLEPSSKLPLSDVKIGTLLRSIRSGLQTIAAENTFAPDPTGGELRRRLATVMEAADIETLMAILAGVSELSLSEQQAFVATALGPYMVASDAQGALTGSSPPSETPGQARYEWLLARLLDYFRRTLGTSLIVQELADLLRLSTATVANLVTWYPADPGPSGSLLDDFLALPSQPREPVDEPTPVRREEGEFATYFSQVARIHKGALVLGGLGLSGDEVDWLRQHGVTEGWLDPTDLPLTASTTAEGRFRSWARLAAAMNVRKTLPSDGKPFTWLMDQARGGATKAAYQTNLIARTQWSLDTLKALAGDPAVSGDDGSLDLAYPADYRSEKALDRLLNAFSLIDRLGASAQAISWISPTVTAAQAANIRNTVKSKYSVDGWADVAKPLRDGLRERQRDALVSYLLANRPAAVEGRWADANDVYGWFLVDVEMSACQGTSRIVQANGSIQLFVQRCLLNLEPEVLPDAEADSAWLQWKWMSRYRVWEANRKIFLYPENWLEPAWRKGKSDAFQDLENELMQNEVSKETAEGALRGYLDRLDAIGRLEVMGLWHDPGSDGSTPILEVIGRVAGDPPTLYRRQWVGSSRWTAWQKIDLDVNSAHVLPVVWNRRLYLFWIVGNRKANATQEDEGAELGLGGDKISIPPARKPEGHLEVQLAWSELRDGTWQAKRTSPQIVTIMKDVYPHQVTLKSTLSEDLLHIDLYAEPFGDSFQVAQFVLGGVGSPVEAFVRTYFGTPVENAGPETRFVGELDSSQFKTPLERPPNTKHESNSFVPRTIYRSLPPDRPRVVHFAMAYDPSVTSPSGSAIGAPDSILEDADFYRLVTAHQVHNARSSLPFFYSDSRRAYFVVPQLAVAGPGRRDVGPAFPASPFLPVPSKPVYHETYRFYPFYFPYLGLLTRELNRGGVDALLSRTLQLDPAGVAGGIPFDFADYYAPTGNVSTPYPAEDFDFRSSAGYGVYNWELFFHVPFLIGRALSQNQRFEDAKRWYEYIFNPTSASSEAAPQRFWMTKPLHQLTSADYADDLLDNLMASIHEGDPDAEQQVAEWRANPFDPHLIASMRPVAYQRSVVMKYIENLIAWGDNLFRQDTMESVNEATQLYVLAAQLLGPRPQIVPPHDEPPVQTYADLEESLDSFSNAIAAAESSLGPVGDAPASDPFAPSLPIIPPLYFCIPPNEQLLRLWDTAEDRLFKIRHCLNIEGVERQLALFAPVIDPGALVQAMAAGLDLTSILRDVDVATPPYRFRVMIREAIDLAENLRSFGAELLGALEKRDAESLGLLRSGAEKKIQDRMRVLRERMVDDADQAIDVLEKNRAIVEERRSYYAGQKDVKMNAFELAGMAMTGTAVALELVASILSNAGGATALAPSYQVGGSGYGGSPHFTVIHGGKNFADASDGWSSGMRTAASALATTAQMSNTMGSYQRRQDEFAFQFAVSERELEHIDSQTMSAKIRKDIAEKDLAIQEQNAKLAADTDQMLRDKFTNNELYDWMVAQTSATYFQAYQLAYTVAKRAERCFRRDLGLQDSSFVRFGYWDSLKKGLLTGDKLLHDLRRMEAAFFAQHERELEITKHASLVALDPKALVELRATGNCTIRIPELWFDVENPGHYLRRLKTVALTVPCVAGPYTGVSMTLTLLQNETRISTDVEPQYARSTPGDDSRFVDDMGGVSAVVTSHGQNDSGVFELRLDDDRYLPFEGAGAISTWTLRLNPVYPQFDYTTISDVVLHLRFTARDAGAVLATAARDHVTEELNQVALAQSREGLYRIISARQEFGSSWFKFLNPGAGQDQVLVIDTPPESFPFMTRGLTIAVTEMNAYAKLRDAGPSTEYVLSFTAPGASEVEFDPRTPDPVLRLHHFDEAVDVDIGEAPSTPPAPQWTFKLKLASAPGYQSLPTNALDDIVIILRYTVTAP
jgi:hypothetical protein